jgi:transketolase
MMGLPVRYVFTHDSIGLGEDGPTHQPIEQLAALRAIPGLLDLRPADMAETIEAWRAAVDRTDGPAFLALSRQKVAVLDRSRLGSAKGLHKGAYVLAEAAGEGEPDAILIASGAEVGLALSARDELQGRGIGTRVVSMPSWALFAAQDPAYQESVLPPSVAARVSVEAGSSMGWMRWTGATGASVAIDHFGASAPAERLFEEFGFNVANVVAVTEGLLEHARSGAPA